MFEVVNWYLLLVVWRASNNAFTTWLVPSADSWNSRFRLEYKSRIFEIVNTYKIWIYHIYMIYMVNIIWKYYLMWLPLGSQFDSGLSRGLWWQCLRIFPVCSDGIGGNWIGMVPCLAILFYKHRQNFRYCLYFHYEIEALEILVEANIVKTMLRLVV